MERGFGVLNERTRGYLQGHVTYFGYHGCRTVHLILVLEKAFMQSQMIQYLSIEELNILSDHKPILLCLNAKSGDMSNIGDNYLNQNILSFKKQKYSFEIIYEGRIYKRALFNCSQ